MNGFLHDVGRVFTGVARLLALRIAYADAGHFMDWRDAMDVEDSEAKVRAITGCSEQEARAHVIVWLDEEQNGVTDDPLGAAVRVLASGGPLQSRGVGS